MNSENGMIWRSGASDSPASGFEANKPLYGGGQIMKLIPLKQWVCDSCGGVIEKPEDGWFEWYTEMNLSLDTGFRIVHYRESCMYNERMLGHQNRSPSDLGLATVLGSGGLGYLLLKLELSDKGVHKLADI